MLAGCPDKPGVQTTDAATSTTAEPTTTSDTTEAATTSTTTDPTTSTTGSTTSTTTTGPDCSTECMPGDCNDVPHQPLGAACTEDCGCASASCFNYVLGGTCGECKTDADCPGGCTPPNPLNGLPARCNDGGPGDGCDEDATCVDPSAPHCSIVYDVAPIIVLGICSECRDDADCTEPARPSCTPEYDFADFRGRWLCVPNGEVTNNGGCPLTDDGDKVCQSGHCREAVFMGLLKLGVCGECETDADCPPEHLCADPQIDTQTGALIGAICQPV